MKIVFFGSAGFAVPSLEVLLNNHYNIVGVVTAPDRLGGRGKKQVIHTPVQQFASANYLRIFQPQNLKSKDFVKSLKELNADLFVVVAFRMLPRIVWGIPRMGTFNLHSSLLPKYRGAAPINWAIIRGETETGCTTFFIDEKIDTGAIIYQSRTNISPNETAGELHDRLQVLGADLVLKTVKAIEDNRVEPINQKDMTHSLAPKIFREDCEIDFNNNTAQVFNFIRGMAPYPGAWTKFQKGEMKILKAMAHPSWNHQSDPGSFLATNKALFFFTRDGVIEAEVVQYTGKRALPIRDFLNGFNFDN